MPKLNDSQVYDLVATINQLERKLDETDPNTDPMEHWDLKRELQKAYKRLNS